MTEKMECMCVNCGCSEHLDNDLLKLKDAEGSDKKIVENIYCSQCGHQLFLIGKAGEENHYKTDIS